MASFTPLYNFTRHLINPCENEPLVIARVHRVPAQSVWRLGVLGAIAGVVGIIYLFIFILFLCRIRKDPLRQRSPILLLFSAFAGTIALAYMYSRQFFDLVLVCPISYYVMEVSLMLVFMPLLLRCARTIMVWRVKQAAANQTERTEGSKREKKQLPFLIRNQWLYAEWFLVLVLIVMCTIWLIAGIIVQTVSASAANVWNPFCQKKCNYEEGVALRVFLCLVMVLIILNLGLVIIMRNINDEFSIRNELLALCLFSFVSVVVMIIIVFVPGSSWPEQPYVGYVLGIELIGMFIISVCVPLFQSFTRKIFLSDILNKIRGVQEEGGNGEPETADKPLVDESQQPQTTPQAQPDKPVDKPVDTPVDKPAEPTNTDNSQQQQSTDNTTTTTNPAPEQTQPIPNNTTLVDNNTTPTPVPAKPDEPAKPKAAPAQVLTGNKEFDFFLSNKDAKEIFKQFLVREFSVENLMFYTEVQYFKKADAEEVKETADQIFTTYVTVGAPFEINIPNDIRNVVGTNVQKNPIPLDAFFEAEKAVYNSMEKESFPRFQKNKLYQNWKNANPDQAKKNAPNKKPPPKKK